MTKKNAKTWMKPVGALLPALLALLLAAFLWAPKAYADDSPTFSLQEGIYWDSRIIEITCDPGWCISYTTDGREPVSKEPTGPVVPANPTGSSSVSVEITQSCMFRAVAYRQEDNDYVFSAEATRSYCICESSHKPTFSESEVYQQDFPAKVTISCEEGWKIAYTIIDSTAKDSDFISSMEHYYVPETPSFYNEINHVGSNSVTVWIPKENSVLMAIAYQP